MNYKELVVVNISSLDYKDRCFQVLKQLHDLNIDTSNFLFLPDDVKFTQIQVPFIEENKNTVEN